MDTTPDTTDETEDTDPAPDVIVGREWVDATANLAGVDSSCGNLSYVSARPGSDQVLAAVAGQGLFASDAGSDEWVPFGRGEQSAPLSHRTSGIVYDPENPTFFWESGYQGLGAPPNASTAGVNRTDDGGITFAALGTNEGADLVSVDLSDPFRQTLLVGVRGRERAVLSSDGGANWSDVSAGLPTDLGEASFPHVVDATTFLLGTHDGDRDDAAPGIFRTTDAGVTWTRVFDQGVSGPVLDTADGMFWIIDSGGVAGSVDDGASWTVVTDVGPGGGRFLDARRNRIVETTDGTWLSMSVNSIVMSSDRGMRWEQVGPGLPFDPSGFTYSESRGELYLWQNYCDLEAASNPVAEESIVKVEFDPTP